MAKGPRGDLIDALRDQLVPVLERKGFEARPFPKAQEKDAAQLRAAFPFGSMKRRRGGRLDLVEIQLHTPPSPKFVINFGTVPAEGVTVPWGHFSQDETIVSALPDGFRLHSRRFLKAFAWFSAVDQAVALFPEIDAWFETGAIGPHISNIGFRQGR